MSFVENDDMIEALATDRSDEAFAIRILLGRPWRTHDFFDVHILDSTLEELTVDRVTIAKQEALSLIEWERFNDLLRGPLRGRMSGDVEVHDMSSIMTKHDEGEKWAKGRGGYSKEVNCNDVANMVVQKGSPSRRWRLARVDSVLVHR